MKALFYWTCEGNVCHPEKALTKYGEIVRKYALTGNIPQVYQCNWVPLCFRGQECECSPDSQCMIESSDGSLYCDADICFSLYWDGTVPWW
jgi:hypothetical protein